MIYNLSLSWRKRSSGINIRVSKRLLKIRVIIMTMITNVLQQLWWVVVGKNTSSTIFMRSNYNKIKCFTNQCHARQWNRFRLENFHTLKMAIYSNKFTINVEFTPSAIQTITAVAFSHKKYRAFHKLSEGNRSIRSDWKCLDRTKSSSSRYGLWLLKPWNIL